MSLPNYRLQLDVCIRKPIESQSIWLRHVRNLPFVPRNGDTIRLTSEDGESTHDVLLEDVVYDTAEGYFTHDSTDETAVENYAVDGVCEEQSILKFYAQFGFIRLNFPVAQAVRT